MLFPESSRNLLLGGVFLAVLAACGGGSSGGGENSAVAPAPSKEAFAVMEATIADAHTAFKAGRLSCRELVQAYMDRIAAYDRQGPTLKSVIAVSPTALKEADELDALMAAGGWKGPLHCVPVLPKDNFDTANMPTTAGALALMHSQPPDDAFTIARLRAAGAIILGKANMDEFAFGFVGSSSLGGQVRNVYDLAKGPGGSSSGTGTAIAASFAMFGLGSDTGGSIRVPSAVSGLVGVRPSMRLVSQDGVIPLAHFQDTAGPMCRTVEDCALALDAMVGFDASAGSGQRKDILRKADLVADEAEYKAMTGVPASYAGYLDARGLEGARIGVVRALFPAGTVANAQFNSVLETALEKMRGAGATVEDVSVADLSTILAYVSVSRFEFRDNLSEYLSSWPSTGDGHLRSFEAVMASSLFETRNNSTFQSYLSYGMDRETNPEYLRNTDERNALTRDRLTRALDNRNADGQTVGLPYDVLIYPTLQGLNTNLGSSPSTGSANRLSPFSGYPAVSFPAGMAASVPAQPVNLEIIGREFDEGRLLRIAYAYQQHARPRVAPSNVPELKKP